jgi:hypothetical protein
MRRVFWVAAVYSGEVSIRYCPIYPGYALNGVFFSQRMRG